MTPEIEKILAEATPRPWETACDSYGKVRHSRKACLFATVKGDNGDKLVTVAGRIENWSDAELAKIAVNSYEADQERIRVLAEALDAGHLLVTRLLTMVTHGKPSERDALDWLNVAETALSQAKAVR